MSVPAQQHRSEEKFIRQMWENCHVYLNLLPNRHGTPQSLCNPSNQHWPLLALACCDRLHLTAAEITAVPTQSQAPLPGGMLWAGRK